MTVEVASMVAVMSVMLAAYFGIKNTKRADSIDVEKRAIETATINVKLDAINANVNDIKYDVTGVKKDVQDLSHRMIIVEQSNKSLHHRLDEHIGTEKEN